MEKRFLVRQNSHMAANPLRPAASAWGSNEAAPTWCGDPSPCAPHGAAAAAGGGGAHRIRGGGDRRRSLGGRIGNSLFTSFFSSPSSAGFSLSFSPPGCVVWLSRWLG